MPTQAWSMAPERSYVHIHPIPALPMATLTLEHVAKIFPGGIRAVDDLSLSVNSGELLTLVGPSGCGKTTTLRLIAGLESPSAGRVLFDDRDVTGVPPRRRNVAMVFQDHALFPHMSVRQNLSFGLKLRKTPREQIGSRVEEAARALTLDPLLDRRPGTLSGGQRQRVALGRAMVRNPSVLLLDEPLSNLDARLHDRLRYEIRRLHDTSGTTTVCVTHDQQDAMSLGDRVAVLRDGRLQQVADPATLYRQPANRFVAELIGRPAMNFITGQIETENGRLWFRVDDQTRLAVSPQKEPSLRNHVGRSVVLGVRPEHLAPVSAETPSTERLRAQVGAVEQLGADTHVHLRLPHHTLTARLPGGSAPSPGESLDLTVDPTDLLFFDPDTEETIR
ncbi:MAG: ABC transporter ATP-binding protein [Pirellulales bacterium]|nr:ABC transporter ATP-binding protein [Pirellulales bacterium]